MLRLKRKAALAGITLTLLLMAGCAAPEVSGPEQSESAPQDEPAVSEPGEASSYSALDIRYSIPMGNNMNRWVMDGDGNTIPEEKHFEVIRDVETNEAQCLIRTKKENTGQKDEYGSPIVRTLTALYDLEENLLHDWEETAYEDGYGDFVIRHDPRPFMVEAGADPEGFYTALWNYKTMREHMKGVSWVISIGDGVYLAVDNFRSPLGILDSQGEPITGFPPPETYYNAYINNGMIIANSQNPYIPVEDGKPDKPEDILLDRDFRPVLSRESLSGYNMYGDYLFYRDGGKQGVISPEDGSELFIAAEGEWVNYYDGEVAIIQEEYDPSKPDDRHCWLADAAGKVLADGFESLSADVEFAEYYGITEAEHFFGIREGKAELLDREGNVVASAELPGVTSISSIGDGLYAYYVEILDPVTDEYISGTEGLLNSDFEVMIPAGIYEYIRRTWNYFTGPITPMELLSARRTANNGVSRHDILSPSGEIMIENLTEFSDVGPNRIAAIKGFEAGLMDWNGNWIVKRPIFSELLDD